MPRVRNQPLRPQLPGTMRVRGYQTGGSVGMSNPFEQIPPLTGRFDPPPAPTAEPGSTAPQSPRIPSNWDKLFKTAKPTPPPEQNPPPSKSGGIFGRQYVDDPVLNGLYNDLQMTIMAGGGTFAETPEEAAASSQAQKQLEQQIIAAGGKPYQYFTRLPRGSFTEGRGPRPGYDPMTGTYPENFTPPAIPDLPRPELPVVDGVVAHNKQTQTVNPDGTGGGGRDMSPKRPGENFFDYYERIGRYTPRPTPPQDPATQAMVNRKIAANVMTGQNDARELDNVLFGDAAGNPSTDRPADGRYGYGHEGKALSLADVEYLRGQGVTIQADGSVSPADFKAWADTRGGVRPPPASTEPPASEQGDAARAAARQAQPQMPIPSSTRPDDARYGVGHGGLALSEADVAHLRSQGVLVEADGSVSSEAFRAWANENDKRGTGINREAWDAGADTDSSGVLSAAELGAWRPDDARYGVGHGGRNLNANDVAWLRDNQGVPVQADGSVSPADFKAWADKRGGVRPPPPPNLLGGQMYANQPSAIADMTTMQNPYVFGGYGAPPSMPYAGMATPQIPSIMGMAPPSYYGGSAQPVGMADPTQRVTNNGGGSVLLDENGNLSKDIIFN